MRIPVFLLMASALTACSTAPQPQARSTEAQAKLQQLLAGRVAGQPIQCLPRWSTDRMVTIDDSTIAFEDGGTVYVNNLRGECANLASGFYTLVTRSSGGGGLCRSEIAHVVDITTGHTVGSCSLGEFVPYRR